MGELKSLDSMLLTILSDLDWWIAEIYSLAKLLDWLPGHFSQIYLIESCRSLEVLEIQVTDLSFHLQGRRKDGYITRFHTHVSQTMRSELWNSLNVGEYICDHIWWGAGVSGCRIGPGTCLPKVQLYQVGTLSPDPMAWTPPHPQQPICQNSHQISSKKPKRAEVRFQTAQVISLGNMPIMEPKGRDVHDAQTTEYTEARGCPFLHHVSDQ